MRIPSDSLYIMSGNKLYLDWLIFCCCYFFKQQPDTDVSGYRNNNVIIPKLRAKHSETSCQTIYFGYVGESSLDAVANKPQ